MRRAKRVQRMRDGLPTRVPLAAAFPFFWWTARSRRSRSGLTDLLDGWYARKFGQVTATGAAIDPSTDKVFVLTVVGTLVALCANVE